MFIAGMPAHAWPLPGEPTSPADSFAPASTSTAETPSAHDTMMLKVTIASMVATCIMAANTWSPWTMAEFRQLCRWGWHFVWHGDDGNLPLSPTAAARKELQGKAMLQELVLAAKYRRAGRADLARARRIMKRVCEGRHAAIVVANNVKASADSCRTNAELTKNDRRRARNLYRKVAQSERDIETVVSSCAEEARVSALTHTLSSAAIGQAQATLTASEAHMVRAEAARDEAMAARYDVRGCKSKAPTWDLQPARRSIDVSCGGYVTC